MNKLTKRQQQVFDVLEKHIEETGLPPTRAEIAKELGFKSANAAEEHLKALAKKGVIEKIAGTSRGIRILQPSSPAHSANDDRLPIVGKVAAGTPLLAIEHIDDYCPIPSSFFSPAADYLLNVEGDSMIEVGINDGDLLAVHQTNQVKNGDIVVARIEDEVTVKRFEKSADGRHITLHAENSEYAPIHVDLASVHFAIEGISVGVIRRH